MTSNLLSFTYTYRLSRRQLKHQHHCDDWTTSSLVKCAYSLTNRLLTPALSSPACNKNVPSQGINKHLDEGCSANTVVHSSSQEAAQCSLSTGGTSQKTGSSNTTLAPIFTSTKPKSASTQALSSRVTTSSRAKRPVNEDLPTPASKRQKLTMQHAVNTPLAEKLRPKKLEDFVGQSHLMEPGSLLSTMLQTNATWSIVLWGPPG
jgi:putative ATPase